MKKVIFGDNLEILKGLDTESVDMIYIDPPFNTGKSQTRQTIEVKASANGDRSGFQGKRYETKFVSKAFYNDVFGDSFIEFLSPRLHEAYRVLKNSGMLFFHIDYREGYNCRLLLDEIFGYHSLINELIWAYDYGGRPKTRWPAKHDNILVYAKDIQKVKFNWEQLDQNRFVIPNGKSMKNIGFSDVWWHTIVPTSGREKTGYPTQKPLGIIDRIVLSSTQEDDLVLDFFAGSGTIGASCIKHNRNFILVDKNEQAIEVMKNRFHKAPDIQFQLSHS